MSIAYFLFCAIVSAADDPKKTDEKCYENSDFYGLIGIREDCTIIVIAPGINSEEQHFPAMTDTGKPCKNGRIIMIQSQVLFEKGLFKTVHFPLAFVNPNFTPIDPACTFPTRKAVHICNLSTTVGQENQIELPDNVDLYVDQNLVKAGSMLILLNEDGRILNVEKRNITSSDVQLDTGDYKVFSESGTYRTTLYVQNGSRFCKLCQLLAVAKAEHWNVMSRLHYNQFTEYQQRRKIVMLDLPYLIKKEISSLNIPNVDPLKRLFNVTLYCFIGVQMCIFLIPALYTWCFGCPCSGQTFGEIEYERMNKNEAVQKKQAAKKQAELLREQRLRAQQERMLRDGKRMARARVRPTKDANRVKGLTTGLFTQTKGFTTKITK
ncbi:hypothetical protein Tcan_10363 [Toxocara canis]|uniref:Uncharacterized protein n=1 Tax=Toxocara canis TaxID=6265 RepID=A0A0B2VQN2_TOXCA|nr:hypothetical protein Tcan_10363 [Toxocara canis]